MKDSLTQQPEQHAIAFWRQCVLLLLLNSLAFIGWAESRQATISGNSDLVAQFNQVTFGNHRDNFGSSLVIKNLSNPIGSDGDSEPSWLAFSAILNLPVAALLQTVNLHYLTLSIIDDIKYHLPTTRAPPRQ